MPYSLAVQPSVRKTSYLKSFPVFSGLPTELRLKVWKAASFLPRVVPVAVKEIGKMPISGNQIFKYTSPIGPPMVLQICQESRAEGLKHYKAEFGVKLSGHGVTTITDRQIYINFASDTIWPVGPYTFTSFGDFCKRAIQHIAITISPYENQADFPGCMIQDQAFDYLRVKTVTLCHPSCFDPRVAIEFEAPVLSNMKNLSLMSPADSQYGLVWAKAEIERIFANRERECADRVKRNNDAMAKGYRGTEKTADEHAKGPWVRPNIEIKALVQQRPVGWPVHGWYVDGVDQFQPED